MGASLEEARRIISELSPEDRQKLLDQLTAEKLANEEAWLKEAEKRWEEVEQGRVESISGSSVRAEGKRLLGP